MKKGKIVLALFIHIIFLLTIGVSTWIIGVLVETKNSINHNIDNNEMVDVNVHYRAQSAETKTTTEYFIPKTYSVEHNISATDKDGNTSYQEFVAPVYNGTTGNLTNSDKKLQYWDVNNGIYTKINQHNNNVGPEQIKSLKITVDSWEPTTDSATYGVVWKTIVNPNDTTTALRFVGDQGNMAQGHGHKYAVGDIYKEDEEILRTTETHGDTTIITIVYQRITIYDRKEVIYGNVTVACAPVNYAGWFYYPQYEQRMVKITQTKGEIVDRDNVSTIRVKKNSIISPFDLNVENHNNYGFFEESDYSVLFDFSKPITNTKDIYLRYVSSAANLSTNISSLKSGETLNLYDQHKGGSGTGTNISLFPSYYDKINALFIDQCTIENGATLNLTFSNEQISIDPSTGSFNENLGNHRNNTDNSIAPDYDGSEYIGNSDCSCYIILNGDLTVRGTLNIGAKIGGYESGALIYSYIIGQYAKLDLYGHTIIVDGGVVNSLGIIKDSVGGGKIIVKNGGKLQTVITVTDGRGRDTSVLGTTKRQSPFTEYKLSYLQVPVYFYNGTNFEGYLKVDFGTMGIINVYLNLIGNTFNESLFTWNGSSDEEYVYYKPYQIPELSTPDNSIIYKYMYNWRNRFEFNANLRQASSLILSASVKTPIGNINADIDFARIDTPISPFMDFILNGGYTLEINSKMTFYPGSSFIANRNSTIDFNYYRNMTYQQISAGITLPGETRYIAGGIMSYTNRIKDFATNGYSASIFNKGIYSQDKYWEYVKESNVIIDGKINFNDGIDTSKSDGFYYLSGNITICNSSLEIIKNKRRCIKTYDLKSELQSGFLYDNTNQSLSTEYLFATSYNISPLISNEKAFIIDANYELEGAFDKKTCIFTNSNNKKYFLKTDQDMYEDGSSGSNQGSRIDRNIEISEIEQTYESYKIIKEKNGGYYLYYCGLYVPLLSEFNSNLSISNNHEFTINARKFMSNSDALYSVNVKKLTINEDGSTTTVNIGATKVASCFSKLVVKYSSLTKEWSYYCFEDYPKTGINERYIY